MKELSIEEKAKRYDEALKAARDVYTYYCDDREQLRKIKSIFPELEESKDEKMLNDILMCGEHHCYLDAGNIDWLKSLKNKVQPKQEWSQNDIDMIDWLIRCCEKEHEELCNDKYGHQDIVSDLKRDCRKKWDWLESLKNKVAPQKQWKPNEEQMKQLGWIAKLNKDNMIGKELMTLYNDLQKLKKE